MIRFFPFEEETRLLELSEDQLRENFAHFVKPLEEPENISTRRNSYLFNGVWKTDGFSISLKLRIPNNFIPIIRGSVVQSGSEMLIRLTYEFFPATKRLLLFWTVLTLLITLFFIVLYQAWIYGAISFGFCLVNYILSIENFKIQKRKSKRSLDKLLSSS